MMKTTNRTFDNVAAFGAFMASNPEYVLIDIFHLVDGKIHAIMEVPA